MSDLSAEIAKAERAAEQGRFGEAVAHWEFVVGRWPSLPLLLRYASALDQARRAVEAEQVMRSLILTDPRYADAYFRLGILLEEQERLAEADRVLTEGLKLEESQPVLTILGSIRYRLGDVSGALQAYTRAAELDPTDSEPHYGLGMVLKKSDPQLAVKHFRESLKLDPTTPGLHRELGHALWYGEQHDDAAEFIQQAIAADPTDAWAHDYLGHLLEGRGDLRAAKEQFQSAIECDDTIPLFWCNLAEVCAQLGQVSEAERLFREALGRHTADSITNLKYGLFLKESGRMRKAADYLRRALEQNPQEERARQALASIEALQRKGDV